MARKLTVEILGDASSLERALGNAGKATTSFGSKTSKLGGNLAAFAKGGAIGAAAGGLALLGKSLFDSVGAAKEAEAAQARLESALASANVSYAKHGDAIDSAIQKTSKLAAIDDEELSDAFAKLVRTSGDVTKATEGMALAANIARARNISLKTATNVVEKAMVGQTRGLKSVGVELEKGMTSTQALAKAQAQFAGAAEKHGQTAAGAQEKLGVAFENLQEKIGQKLLPILAKLAEKAVEVVSWLEKHGDDMKKGFETAWRVIKPIFDNMKKVFENTVEGVKAMVTLVKAVIDGDWSKAWGALKTIVSNAFDNVKTLFGGALTLLGEAALKLGKGLLEKIVEGVTALPGAVVAIVKKIPAALLAIGAKTFEGITAVGGWVLDKIIDGVKTLGSKVVSLVKAIPALLLALGAKVFEGLKAVGGWVLDAIVDGVSALGGKVAKLVKAIPAALLAVGAKFFSGLSKVGEWIKDAVVSGVSGIGRGVLSWVVDAINSAIRLINKAIDVYNRIPFAPDIGKLPQIGGGGGGGEDAKPPGGLEKFPDKKAKGGPVKAGSPYIIGEKGPELFVPAMSGQILSAAKLASAGRASRAASALTADTLRPRLRAVDGGARGITINQHVKIDGPTFGTDRKRIARELGEDILQYLQGADRLRSGGRGGIFGGAPSIT